MIRNKKQIKNKPKRKGRTHLKIEVLKCRDLKGKNKQLEMKNK